MCADGVTRHEVEKMKSDLNPNLQYRVMVGGDIIGDFSDLKLATATAFEHSGSVVLDMSVKPPLVVYGEYGRAMREEE